MASMVNFKYVEYNATFDRHETSVPIVCRLRAEDMVIVFAGTEIMAQSGKVSLVRNL